MIVEICPEILMYDKLLLKHKERGLIRKLIFLF